MARERDSGLWQAWRERMRRFRSSLETVADFCRRERVSVAAFYQWKRKLDPDGKQPGVRQGAGPGPSTAPRAAVPRRSRPPFIELVVPARPATIGANSDRDAAVPAGCVEVRLPNGVCVCLVSGDLSGLRTAILAACEIREGGVAGDAPC